MTFQLPAICIKVMSRCLSATNAIPTSLPPKPLSIFNYPNLNSSIGHYDAFSQPLEKGFIRYMPSPSYPASILFFQLHGGMVSLMQALATPFSTIHNTWILTMKAYQVWLLLLNTLNATRHISGMELYTLSGKLVTSGIMM